MMKKYDRLWKSRSDHKGTKDYSGVKIRESQISGFQYQDAEKTELPGGCDTESYEELYAARQGGCIYHL